jgi:hypothetical protein
MSALIIFLVSCGSPADPSPSEGWFVVQLPPAQQARWLSVTADDSAFFALGIRPDEELGFREAYTVALSSTDGRHWNELPIPRGEGVTVPLGLLFGPAGVVLLLAEGNCERTCSADDVPEVKTLLLSNGTFQMADEFGAINGVPSGMVGSPLGYTVWSSPLGGVADDLGSVQMWDSGQGGGWEEVSLPDASARIDGVIAVPDALLGLGLRPQSPMSEEVDPLGSGIPFVWRSNDGSRGSSSPSQLDTPLEDCRILHGSDPTSWGSASCRARIED